MTDLQELYRQIPGFECRKGCTDCCGPVPRTSGEFKKIASFLAERGKELRTRTSTDCPYIEEGECSIYKVRPLMCRLYGTLEDMSCPHGCKPDLFLSESTAHDIMDEYMEEMLTSYCHTLETLL